MLSPELLELAKRRVRVEFEERTRSFVHEVQRIMLDAVGQNSDQSTVTKQLMSEAMEREVEVRASLVWQILGRILATQPLPVHSGLATQLKSFVAESLEVGREDIRQVYDKACAIMPGAGAVKDWEQMRSFALEKVETEIDLSLLAVGQTKEQGARQPTINVYQPFGIVQVGHGSSAMVVHELASGERQQLREALESIKSAIGTTQELPVSQRSDLNEVIEEAQSEIEKPSPNRIRLQGVLAAIAAGVQTLGSVKDAYAALKGAATLIGVHLP